MDRRSSQGLRIRMPYTRQGLPAAPQAARRPPGSDRADQPAAEGLNQRNGVLQITTYDAPTPGDHPAKFNDSRGILSESGDAHSGSAVR